MASRAVTKIAALKRRSRVEKGKRQKTMGISEQLGRLVWAKGRAGR